MSFAPCAEQLRECITLLDRLTPTPTSSKNPHKYHEDKSEIRRALVQVADMLEGRYVLTSPKEQKPLPPKRAPYTVEDRRGNIVKVDFAARRRIAGPDAAKG